MMPAKALPRATHPTEQRGAVLILTLIALLILLLSTMGLIRTFDTSLNIAGNLAFKRDLVNQAERGMAKAIALFTASTGALSSSSAREANSLPNNYSAKALDSDAHGVPLALINDSTFKTLGMTGKDITDTTSAVTVRYVIDRQCASTGAFSTSNCASANLARTAGGSSSKLKKNFGQEQAVYRISIRVQGPRNTEAYLQTTITR